MSQDSPIVLVTHKHCKDAKNKNNYCTPYKVISVDKPKKMFLIYHIQTNQLI